MATQMMKPDTADTLGARRRALAGVLRVLEPYDGQHARRLGTAAREKCAAAIARADGDITPRMIETREHGHAPRIDLAPLRAEIAETERRIHALDTLQTLPELDTYATAYNAYCAASTALREAATAAGVPYGDLCRLVRMASF